MATLSAILVDDPPEIGSTTAPGLDRIVRRCLEKQPVDRFHSAHDLGLTLDLPATTAVAAPPTEPGGMSMPRRKMLAYGAASVALLASGFTGGTLVAGPAPASATPTSFRRLTFRRGLIRSARVAPDGQTIYYGALWDGDQCRVHSVRPGSPESSPLDLPAANVLAVSRDGELALTLGPQLTGTFSYGTLARVPITGGAPREMVENVKAADWSPDGSELAIVRSVDGRDRIEYPIGNVLVAPGAGESTGLGFVRISPDGGQVAFIQTRTPQSLEGRVCITDMTGSVTELTEEYLNVHGLAWKDDEIWYTAADDRPLFRALCSVRPGGTPRVLARVPGNVTLWDTLPDGGFVVACTDDRAATIIRDPEDDSDRDLSWLDASWAADLSRDGRLLLFTEMGQGGGPENAAYLRGTDGSPAVRLGTGAAYALSPDARWAICAAPDAAYGNNTPYLEIVPTGAGEPRRVQGNGIDYFNGARWLPDGNRIVTAGVEPGGRARVYLLELEGDRQIPLTPEGVTTWAVSPDGSMVAARGPTPAIQLHPVDGGSPRDVPGSTGGESLVGWIDDGLLVIPPASAGARLGDVYAVNIETGRQDFWHNILPRDAAGIMELVRFRTTPDGRTRAYTWHRSISDLYIAGQPA